MPNHRPETQPARVIRLDTGAALYAYPTLPQRPWALILPGGGYAFVSLQNEGYPIARAVLEQGWNAAILQYRTGRRARAPHPLDDVAAAVRAMQAAPDAQPGVPYAIIGFSAGGHLAACWCTAALGARARGMQPPAAALLGYPVITMGAQTHRGSRRHLLGLAPTALRVAAYSVEKQADEGFPPTFVWQCDHDDCVPFANSQLLAGALTRLGVPHALLAVPGHGHGWGLGKGTAAEGWWQQAADFLRPYLCAESAEQASD